MPLDRPLRVALKVSVSLPVILPVKEVELVPYRNPVSVTVPVSTEYEPDRVAPV